MLDLGSAFDTVDLDILFNIYRQKFNIQVKSIIGLNLILKIDVSEFLPITPFQDHMNCNMVSLRAVVLDQ